MVSVVLPTFNEADNIEPLLTRLVQVFVELNESYELVVVDDDSPDKTWEVVERMARSNPSIRLIRRIGRRGLTSAIDEGIRACRGVRIGWLDCDLSQPPELLAKMLAEMASPTQPHCIVASRYLDGGKDIRHGKFALQRVLSRILYLLARNLLALPVSDVTSGYVLVRREALLPSLPLRGDYGEYFIDLMVRLHLRGARFVEVPYSLKNREYGESKTATHVIGYATRGVKYLWIIFKYALIRLTGTRNDTCLCPSDRNS